MYSSTTLNPKESAVVRVSDLELFDAEMAVDF
jgi:hypothetical protein